MVADDALVTALVRKGDVAQVEDGRVLRHACGGGGGALGLSAHVGVVLRLGASQRLLVLAPGEGHGGRAAAGGRAGESHVAAEDRRAGFRLNGDLGFGKVI